MNSKQTGRLGEDAAARYLKQKGFRILARNFERKVSRFLKSEIDIIAKKEGIIHFVEVKAVKEPHPWVSPEQRVDFKKKRKLIKTAELWLAKNKIPLDSQWQIDIVAITNLDSTNPQISHFENIVSK